MSVQDPGIFKLKKGILEPDKEAFFLEAGQYVNIPLKDLPNLSKNEIYAFLRSPFIDVQNKYSTVRFKDLAKQYPVPEGFCLTQDEIDPCPPNICCPSGSQRKTVPVPSSPTSYHHPRTTTVRRLSVFPSKKSTLRTALLLYIVLLLLGAFTLVK